jgi:hypothetical protein
MQQPRSAPKVLPPNQDALLAEHHTVAAASFSGGVSSDGDAKGADTAAGSLGQPSDDRAGIIGGIDAALSAADQPQVTAQQLGRDTVRAREAAGAAQSAQMADGSSAAEEEDQVQASGPFEPEAIVNAIAAEDPKPRAQVDACTRVTSSSWPCVRAFTVLHWR